jgi:uncharacterized repeat protein (TIGR02543 family)
MKKHLGAAVLTLVLTLGLLCVPAYAADAAAQVFPDVASGDWYYSDVMSLYEAGVVNGFNDGTFRPNETVTTGQALKMVILAAGYEAPETVASHWARGYLNMALSQKFIDKGEIVDLDVNMSRALVAKVAARALGLQKTSDTYYFSDAQGDDNIQALYEQGILLGYSDATVKPDRSLSRAELSAIVYRIYAYVEKQVKPDNELDKLSPSDFKLRTTEDGIAFIKAMEGFIPTAYWDYSQYSIGYGSSCSQNQFPSGITEKEADILLRQKLDSMEDTLDAFLTKYGITVTDKQYDALSSFTYNVGSTWMNSNYRLAALLIRGGYTDNELSCAMGIWCHVTQSGKTLISDALITRRIREVQIFLYGDYTGKSSSVFYPLIYTTEKGKVEVDVALYKEGTQYDPLFGASNSGDTFLGWFTSSGEEITATSTATGRLSVTASWQSDTDPAAGTGTDTGTGTENDSGWVTTP